MFKDIGSQNWTYTDLNENAIRQRVNKAIKELKAETIEKITKEAEKKTAKEAADMVGMYGIYHMGTLKRQLAAPL